MVKFIVFVACLSLSSAVFSQTIKFKITGMEDTTINLVRYFGKNLFYADTAEMKKGVIEFDGSKHKAGILALYLPGQQLLEFVYNKEDVYIESTATNPMPNAKVKVSAENNVFMPYVAYISKERGQINILAAERDSLDKDSQRYKTLTTMIEDKNKEVIAYQKELIKNHPTKLVSALVKMSMDIDIPEAPVNEKGEIIDSNFRYKYFRQHYFDNMDFKDDRLVNTQIYHTKLENYFKGTYQHWDTIIKYAFALCDQLPPKSDLFQYTVSWITSNYEQSKIMGMDKVFVYMGGKYYCSKNDKGESPAFWMPEDNLKKFCEQMDKMDGLVMGIVPENICLVDTSDQVWRDYHSLKSEYTILYFWDPECGHCKKITPKLQELYAKKFRERNIEIFAVGKATGEDFEKWKKFVKVNNLEFINVAMTDRLYKEAKANPHKFIGPGKPTTIESLNYQTTFDVFMTPKLFLLDKDKKIIAKGLNISQLEDFLDILQGMPEAEKLFPIEEQPKDEDIH